jgi:uncharacterized protein (TIGR02453 family)
MPEECSFQGFSKETITFFRGLKRNNNREWFERHRNSYQDHVLEPAKAFVRAMGVRLREISPRIIAAPKVNKSLFRLNRDTRFSPDKSPYKPNLGIYFWEGTRSRMESPGFYVHLEPPILLLGTGYYMFPDWLIERYRRAVVHPQLGTELAKIVKIISKKTDFEWGGKHYKRVPPGYDPTHPNAELLLHNGLHAGWETPSPAELFTPHLVEYCYEKFKPLAPLHHWLVALMERAWPPPGILDR